MSDEQTTIEVRLRPDQWTTLANMLARAACVTDVRKTPAEQARDREQATKMKSAIQTCRNGGCAMSQTAERWQKLIRTGERLAKYSSEWSALGALSAAASKQLIETEN